MRKSIISFKNFSFKYDAQKEATLKNINLNIYEGEKIIIAGASGSGKSTLANCINGLCPHAYPGESKGTLLINDNDSLSMDISKLSNIVGTVLQDPDGQFVGLTVGEDIAFILENNNVKLTEMHKKVLETATLVSVERLLNSSPYELSGGQKQRVSMAGVLVEPIKILLFDEPLANLDPYTGKHAIGLIDEIHKKTNTTTIIIEHRIEDAMYKNVDRIVLIDNGEIKTNLTPNNLLSSPLLKEYGIREPLYITALKYAGCVIDPAMLPEHIDTINLTNCKNKIIKWYETSDPLIYEKHEEELLELRNINFSYDGINPIIKNISLKINKGEMLSIVGENGAGKSTLSSLICGFEDQDSGEILLNGIPLLANTIRQRAKQIGFVMQNPNEMISKTMIFDEVTLGLQKTGLSDNDIAKKVNETLKICGLYQFRNWPISALSFGQKKRVTIASVLALDPKIIILDEPTAGQDFRHYTEIMEFLKTVNQLGVTIILITHDMHLMLEYSNRAIVLTDGKVISDKPPSEVLTDLNLIAKASLKETSLYNLAKNCGIDDASSFVEHFINHDRKVRKNEQKN